MKEATSLRWLFLFQRHLLSERNRRKGAGHYRGCGYKRFIPSCEISGMRMSLKLCIVIAGICIVLTAVPACGRTDTSDGTSTAYYSPTQIPINTPIASRTQPPIDPSTKTQTQPNSATPISTPDMPTSRQKLEIGSGYSQVDVGALIQKSQGDPEILSCLMGAIGMSTLMELTQRIPTAQELELVLSCFDAQSTSSTILSTKPQHPVVLAWPEDVGVNRIGKLGNELSGWEGGWIRPHAGRFIWGLIEPDPGRYVWTITTDRQVERWQNENLAVLVTIWPFADWDQDSCHSDKPEAVGMFPGMGSRLYSPCNKEAYSNWLTAVVERYDGDGINDMPGLKYPIRHWEVLNEPEMQGPELTFYQEDSNSYLELLKLSHQAIKAADPNSQVLLGGQAGMQSKFVDYWKPIIRGASGYFDIGNIHSISSRDLDFFASEYREFLDDNAFERTRFWVTEALVGIPPGEQKLTDDELARRTMTGYASSFAAGADVIFNVGGHDPTGGPGRLSAKTVELMAQTLGTFNTVFQLGDNLVEFEMPNGNSVFVLWDNAVLPPTVRGKVTVIDYLGNENIEEATEVSGLLPKMAIVDSKQ